MQNALNNLLHSEMPSLIIQRYLKNEAHTTACSVLVK